MAVALGIEPWSSRVVSAVVATAGSDSAPSTSTACRARPAPNALSRSGPAWVSFAPRWPAGSCSSYVYGVGTATFGAISDERACGEDAAPAAPAASRRRQ